MSAPNALKRLKDYLSTTAVPAVKNSGHRILSVLPYGMRRGGAYRRMAAVLVRTGRFSKAEIAEYQLDRFRKVYAHAIRAIPFYRRWYGEHGLHEGSIGTLDDVRRVPLLTKDMVRENLKDMVLPGYPAGRMVHHRTGGSTGQPLHFYSSREDNAVETAFVDAIWSRAGYRPGDLKVALRRSVRFGVRDGIYQYMSYKDNTLYLSIYRMDRRTALAYRDIIARRKARFLYGYPSAIHSFAQILREEGCSPPELKAVLGVSEGLRAGQREIIEKTFNCRLFTFYGLSEHVSCAAECERSPRYHVVPEYGLTEIVDADTGELIREPGRPGEIVGTGFYNFVMPLLRYRTADIASFAADQTCPCGRPHEILEAVFGRSQEYLILPDMSRISMTGSYNELALLSEITRGFQFVQEVPGEVTLLIVPFEKEVPAQLVSRIREMLSGRITSLLKLSITQVEELHRTEAGKTPLVVQKVKSPPRS
jgi:phenylacetate-CoA ligase